VFAPNVFSFAPDSSATGLEKGVDAGLGVAYSYNNLMVGIGFGKVNKPAAYPFPISVIKRDPADSTQFLLKDTSIMLESSNYGIELNFNVVYQWDPSDKVKMIHSFHVGNFDLAGADYVGLQNIAEINNRHSIGLGGFYNGTPGFIGTLGFGVTENLKIESTTFLAQDLNFDRSVGRFGDYIRDGYKPSFEFNLRFEF